MIKKCMMSNIRRINWNCLIIDDMFSNVEILSSDLMYKSEQ